MTSDSNELNKRSRKKLRASGALKCITLEFRENEMELYDFAKEHVPTATYIKHLIREDMERSSR